MRHPVPRTPVDVKALLTCLGVCGIFLVGGCGGDEGGARVCAADAPCRCADGSAGVRVCHAERASECSCQSASGLDAGGADASGFHNSLDAALPDWDATLQSAADARTVEADTTCGEQSSQAELQEERPVDVIFIIDNSGSMSSEISAVERNINRNFADIIAASGADYRVIMITDHGSATYDVCIEPPLAGLPCSDTTLATGTTLGAPANTARFYHYDINVQSWDSVCLMLQHYSTDPIAGPVPETGAAASPTGWNAWLRPEALKVFVEITDDRLSCSATATNPDWDFSAASTDVVSATQLARRVSQAVLGLSAPQFGTPEKPNFVWHSIVGIGANDPVELPYTHFDPPKLAAGTQCSSAVNPGPTYQMLSIGTGGLRYPVCAADEGHGYDGVFRAIAHEVVRGARVECAFNIPSPPPGKFVDFGSVVVEYVPGGGGATELFERVKEDACNDASFYFGETEIKLCPQACDRVRGDTTARLDVVFGCGPQVEFDPTVF